MAKRVEISMARGRGCVWVVELLCLNAKGEAGQGAHWEIWEACNTREEAVRIRDGGAMGRKLYRIRKYIPAVTHG